MTVGVVSESASLAVNSWVSALVGVCGALWLLGTVTETLVKKSQSDHEVHALPPEAQEDGVEFVPLACDDADHKLDEEPDDAPTSAATPVHLDGHDHGEDPTHPSPERELQNSYKPLALIDQ